MKPKIMTGFNYTKEVADQEQCDWELGAFGQVKKCITYGIDLMPYLPLGEVQRSDRGDMMDCTARAVNNDQEAKDTACIKEKLYSEGFIQWLKDNGFASEDGNVELSDAFLSINAGTTPNGNSLKAPWKAFTHVGAIPKAMLPLEPWMNWYDYHNKNRITEEMRKLGKEYLRRKNINYEKVYLKDFTKHDLNVVGYAWPKSINGIYPRVDAGFNHAFYRLKNKPIHTIFDNYLDDGRENDFIKQLASNYKFMHYGYRSIISENKDVIYPKPKKEKIMQLLKAKTDPRVFIKSETKEKTLLLIDNESTLKVLQNNGWVSEIEEIDDALLSSYYISAPIITVDYEDEKRDSILTKLIKFIKSLKK